MFSYLTYFKYCIKTRQTRREGYHGTGLWNCIATGGGFCWQVQWFYLPILRTMLIIQQEMASARIVSLLTNIDTKAMDTKQTVRAEDFTCFFFCTCCTKFDVHVIVYCVKISYNKPTRCANFTNLFLEGNSTCFGQFLCPSSGIFFTVHTAVVYVTHLCWHIPLLCVQWKTPDDGQRNCPKHVDFPSKNKFEKLVHLVGLL